MKFYKAKFNKKLAEFNHVFQLPGYFEPMFKGKKEVKIADLGAGPVSTTGSTWPGVKVEIYASDVLMPEYLEFWKGHTPVVPVVYQDMEKLTYPDNFFDIVHCVNALDHTPNAVKAIEEMRRICKLGGCIYLRHSPDQKKRYGGMHQWNAGVDNGIAYFDNDKERIYLYDFRTEVQDGLIVSRLCLI